MKTFGLGLLALLPGLVFGCDCSRRAGGVAGGGSPDAPAVASDGRPRLQRPGRLVSSPFLAQCRAVPVRGGRLAQLVDDALGRDRGETVWAHREFGSGGESGGQAQYDSTADYGGEFIFRRDAAERPVTAADADAILRALKSALERELKNSGVSILDDKVATDGMFLTGFSLTYEDPGMPAGGSIDASITLPKSPTGLERHAGLTLRHRETCRLDRLGGK